MQNKPDTDAFLSDLYALRQIGSFKSGVHRPTYSAADMQSRAWLSRRMEDFGLEATVDGIGNVVGRNTAGGKILLAGSHVETQNEAGWLDGALGVVSALHLARAGLAVDVVAFADEEGHYGSFLGSRSFVGLLEDNEIDQLRNRYHGKPLREALAEAGLSNEPRLRMDENRYCGFLEMHIEQGTELESENERVGVVTGIVAIWQYKIVFEGRQDHAGGTTMAERRDAGLAAVRLLSWIDDEFPKHVGPRTVWTCGRITLSPGAPSVIPGKAEVMFQFRDISTDVLVRLDTLLRRAVQDNNRTNRCRATLEVLSQSRPAICDETMQSALAGAAELLAPSKWRYMPSGAGHDAQYLARKLPAAMLFVPSIDGISHHWAENTSDDDLAMGFRIFYESARRILAGEPQRGTSTA